MKSNIPNMKNILKVALIFLKINGIILDGKTGFIEIACTAMGLFLSGSYFLFCVFGLIVYWESIESLSNAEGLPLSSKVFLCLILTRYKKNQWMKLLNKAKLLNLHEKLIGEDRVKVDQTIKFYIKFAYIYSTVSIFSVVIYYLKSMYYLMLPLPMYTICDIDKIACYIPYLIYEIMLDIFIIPFYLGINVLYMYIVLAIICEIEAIKCGIRKIHAETNMKELSVLVEQHNQVSLIVDEFRNVGRNSFLIIYTTSMLLVCVIFYMTNRNGFPPNENELIRYVPLTLVFILEFYTYAYGASKLSETIESVGDEVYSTVWPDITDLGVRKSLLLMIQKSQTTKKLTIGGLLIMDLAVFIKFMQNTFSFYTLMSNIGQEDI